MKKAFSTLRGVREKADLARTGPTRHVRTMLNIVSILIGLVTLALGLVAFIPLLGWMNWLVIPIGIVGAAVGALSSSSGGRNLNIVLIIIFALRLMFGGGIF
jgi:hypothetical protein